MDPAVNPDGEQDASEDSEEEDDGVRSLVSKEISREDVFGTDYDVSATFDFGRYGFEFDLDPLDEAKVGVSGEITEAEISLGLGNDAVEAEVTGTLNTVNGQLGGELDWTGKDAGLSANAGAEAMVVNGRAQVDVRVTPKTVGDALGDLYNDGIDPIVDAVAGRDVPGIPEVPDTFDKGLTIKAHGEAGIGASAKGSVDIGGTNGRPGVGLSSKLGLGGVVGVGARVELAW